MWGGKLNKIAFISSESRRDLVKTNIFSKPFGEPLRPSHQAAKLWLCSEAAYFFAIALFLECELGDVIVNNSCVDIDECNRTIHNCDENAMCYNIQGSFQCVCLSGYQGDGINCERCDSRSNEMVCEESDLMNSCSSCYLSALSKLITVHVHLHSYKNKLFSNSKRRRIVTILLCDHTIRQLNIQINFLNVLSFC